MKALHFVTGGFSGATSVAADLVRAATANGSTEAILVLRRKRSTQQQRIDALRAEGLQVETVPGLLRAQAVWSLARLCRRLRPDVLVAHGFPEHLIGRWAGLAAGVPHLVHVEHNARERYGTWGLAQARWLARRTDRIVGVSADVRDILVGMGMPPRLAVAIPNGIRLERFEQAGNIPFAERELALVMVARFAGQKDHATLLRALHRLRQDGLTPRLRLAGIGNARHERAARALCTELGLTNQVEFLGHVSDIPTLLGRHRIALLSSHYEGFGLALAEGMASGCAAIGTDVAGIRTLIRHGEDGLLVPHEDAAALAQAIRSLLVDDTLAARLARTGRERALREFGRDLMVARYEQLLRDCVAA